MCILLGVYVTIAVAASFQCILEAAHLYSQAQRVARRRPRHLHTSLSTTTPPAAVSDQGDPEPAQGPLEEHARAGNVEHAGRHLLHQRHARLPVQRAGAARAHPHLCPVGAALVREHHQVRRRRRLRGGVVGFMGLYQQRTVSMYTPVQTAW